MNHNELKHFFDGQLQAYAKISTRIGELKTKLAQINTMEDDSLIQLNMGLAIFSVGKESAVKILSEAIEVEQNYFHIMTDRFHRAVGVINGE